jgi:predicted nucleic acid-binding protein
VIGIADTGFLVAFANRKDKFHDWALAIAEDITEPLKLPSTCKALAMIHTGLITLAFDCNDHRVVTIDQNSRTPS